MINKEKSLSEHSRLHLLFKENRVAFEIERKQIIESAISQADSPDAKEKLRKLQEKCDNFLNHAGSEHNRLVLI